MKNKQPTDDGDKINKAYRDENLLKMNGHLSILNKITTILQTICRRNFN